MCLWKMCFGVTCIGSWPLAPCGPVLSYHAAEWEYQLPLLRAVLPLQINDGADITLSLRL